MNLLSMIACSLVLAVSSGSLGLITPVIATSLVHHRPHYAYNYAVNDPHTHDQKAQWELRDGGTVKGSYSLVEPDGSLRVVDYHADKHTGFNAVVKKLGPGGVISSTRVPAAPIAVAPLAPIATIPVIKTPLHVSYGFGVRPATAHKPALVGDWSLPWDPHTHSFGGWVPISPPSFHGNYAHRHLGPWATLVTKKYNSKGKLVLTKISAPIPISPSGKLVIKKRH